MKQLIVWVEKNVKGDCFFSIYERKKKNKKIFIKNHIINNQ